MKKITPHLWFDKEAVEATAFYTTLFPDSKVNSVTPIHDTPSGDAAIVSCQLAGQNFMAISAGPIFKLNPSISMFTAFDTEEEIQEVWDKLIEGGKEMMPLQEYPWAKKYGWLQDRFGLTWQLTMTDQNQYDQKITPALMFTKDGAGKAKEAIEFYTSLFPNSRTDILATYEAGEGDVVGYIKHGRFALNGQSFIAMDSSGPHQFVFNEAISFIVNCETQEEIDFFWEKLSAVPEAEQCGWLKDKFGVSWQIVPTIMAELMASGDAEKTARVTQAFLKMKKFNIAELEAAAQ